MSAAGRTDTGVHAQQQVVTLTTACPLEPRRLLRGFNACLPADVQVMAIRPVPLGWDPRQARSRTYLYRIDNGPAPNPLTRRWAYYVPVPLEVAAMAAAARQLEGEHDFAAFRAHDCGSATTRRRILASQVRQEGTEIRYEVRGWAFLRNMVRIVVGTLVEVGRGRRPAAELGQLLLEGRRELAGPTAPPHGLTLLRIEYAEQGGDESAGGEVAG